MSRPRTVSDSDILKTAKALVLERGVQVSTATIARAVGLSQAALFKRFNTKQELLLSALVSPESLKRLQELLEWIDTQPGHDHLDQNMTELLGRIWTALSDVIPRVIALHNCPGMLSGNHKFFKLENSPPLQILERTTGFVERCQERGSIDSALIPRQVALNIMGTLQGRAFFKYILKSTDSFGSDDEYIQQTAGVLARALKPKEQS